MAPSSSSSQHQPSAAADPALLARVREHDAFFCRMVDLVPPELYLPKDEEAAAAADANAKYYKVSSRVCVFVRVALVLVDRLGGRVGSLLALDRPSSRPNKQNKRQAAPKQEKKEASKKGKRVKFDPANMKSVTQLQQVGHGAESGWVEKCDSWPSGWWVVWGLIEWIPLHRSAP